MRAGWLAGGTNKKCSIYVASCEIGAEEIRDGGREGKHVDDTTRAKGEEESVHEEYACVNVDPEETRSYLAILFLPHL